MTNHNNGLNSADESRKKAMRRVIVKFADGVGFPYEFRAEQRILKRYPDLWNRLLAKLPCDAASALTVQPLFQALDPARLKSLIERAPRKDPSYRPPDFLSYFVVPVPRGVEPKALAREFHDKQSWPIVDYAHVESGPDRPPSTGFLGPSPIGIDASCAWAEGPAGKGAGVTFIDIEQGWDFGDANLPQTIKPPINGCNSDAFDHGTAVLSVVAGVGGSAVQGIAPLCKVKVASQYQWHLDDQTHQVDQSFCDSYSTHGALQAALTYLSDHGAPGDVILIEAQTQDDLLPVEVEPAVFDLIAAVTAAGYVVIEAAGNAGESGKWATGLDIDSLIPQDPETGSFRDSGAIVVGAALQGPTHPWAGLTNFGNRVNCFAWGEAISAAGMGAAGNFGGTSGASAIIAGVVVCAQGIAQKEHGARYGPRQLRDDILMAGGTPSSTAATNPIGVMPDLGAIVRRVKNTPPLGPAA